MNKQIPPPWIPLLKSDADSCWFEKLSASKNEARIVTQEQQNCFSDF